MGDFERRSAKAEAEAKAKVAIAAERAKAAWNADVIAWRNKTRLRPSAFIFEVTRGVPAMGNGPNMEAGFNDSFDLWNYLDRTQRVTSFVRNVWAGGRMLVSVERLLRTFPDPQSFADAVAAVEPD